MAMDWDTTIQCEIPTVLDSTSSEYLKGFFETTYSLHKKYI